MDSLNIQGVIFRHTYVLVHVTHPVVRMLEESATGIDLAHQDDWYRITHACFNSTCNLIRLGQCAPPPCGPL